MFDLSIGIGAALIVTGDRGIGKSRFLDECAALCKTVQLKRSVPLDDELETPRVYLIDDVDLSSTAEVMALERLFRRANREPLMAVASVDAMMYADRLQGPSLQCFRRETVDLIELRSLADGESELMIRALTAGKSLSPKVLDELLRTAQGNPRYILELAAAADSHTVLEDLIPDSACAEFRAYRQIHDANALRQVRLASILGERFAAEWLVDAFRQPMSEVVCGLQAACDAGILNEEAAGKGWISFSSRAFQKASYVSLIRPNRLALHRDATRLAASAESVELAIVLARQFEALGEWASAHKYLRQAAVARARDGEYAEAAVLYSRAARHLAAGSPEWVDATYNLVQCRWLLSEHGQIIPLCNSLLACCNFTIDQARTASVIWLLFYAYLNNDDREHALEAAELFETTLENGESLRNAALLVLICAYCGAGHRQRADDLLTRIDIDKPMGSLESWRYSYARVVYDAPFESTITLDESVTVAISKATAIDANSIHCTYLAASGSALITGDIAAAARYCLEASRILIPSNDENAASMLRERLKSEALAFFVEGNLLAAKERLISNLSWRTPGTYNEFLRAAIAVFVGTHARDIALADAFFDPSMLQRALSSNEHELCGILVRGFADLMIVRSMTNELCQFLHTCIDRFVVDPYMFIGVAAARFLPPGDLPRLADYLERYARNARGPVFRAHVQHVQAIIHHRSGDMVAARACAVPAAHTYSRLSWRLAEAACLEIGGNPQAAAKIFVQCGAVGEAERLASCQKRKFKYAPFGARLTSTQYRVAALVARGYADRSIADALKMSVRTVNNHVSAVLSKLGVSKRSAVAASLASIRATGNDPFL